MREKGVSKMSCSNEVVAHGSLGIAEFNTVFCWIRLQ